MNATIAARPGRSAGFTMLELVLAMGLLASFLVLLVQMLTSSATLFQRGERGQEEADRSLAAVRALRDALGAMCGPRAEVPPGDGDVDARLLVHWIDTAQLLSGREADDPPPPRVQALRSTVTLSPAEEERLLTVALRPVAEDQVGADDPVEVDARLAELVRSWPRRGRGELLLLAWPADPSGEFLELRTGVRLADPELLGDDELPLSRFELREDLALDAGAIVRTTTVAAVELMHLEIGLATRQGAGGDDFAMVWDSARAGLLDGDGEGAPEFGKDVGPESLRDPRDDLWPRWVRVTVTVARGGEAAPDAFLRRELGADATELMVASADGLPAAEESPWVKVGNEWIRYGEQRGDRLVGLRRGGRGTTAVAHAQGTPVRAGREAVLWLRVPHGRDGDD